MANSTNDGSQGASDSANELPGMFLLYHVPRSFSETAHNLRGNDVFHHGLQLRTPKNSNDDVIFMNVGEIVPRVFKPSGETAASANPEQLREWSHRLSQAAYRAVENIGLLRVHANDGELFKEIARPAHENETLSELAQNLAQLSEAGTFIMSASTDLGVDVKALEDLLVNPLCVEHKFAAAIDVCDRVVVRYTAKMISSGPKEARDQRNSTPSSTYNVGNLYQNIGSGSMSIGDQISGHAKVNQKDSVADRVWKGFRTLFVKAASLLHGKI